MESVEQDKRGSPEEGRDAAEVDATTTAAARLGKLGGIARMKKLTAEERREIGKKGAAARWGKKAAEGG